MRIAIFIFVFIAVLAVGVIYFGFGLATGAAQNGRVSRPGTTGTAKKQTAPPCDKTKGQDEELARLKSEELARAKAKAEAEETLRIRTAAEEMAARELARRMEEARLEQEASEDRNPQTGPSPYENGDRDYDQPQTRRDKNGKKGITGRDVGAFLLGMGTGYAVRKVTEDRHNRFDNGHRGRRFDGGNHGGGRRFRYDRRRFQ